MRRGGGNQIQFAHWIHGTAVKSSNPSTLHNSPSKQLPPVFGYGPPQDTVSEFDYQIKQNIRGPSLISLAEGKSQRNQDIAEFQREANESRLADSISKMPKEI